jgi:NAD(P)-dependent dehydrogenase (short-subunit alcohol dehydrogenase family)
MEIRDKVAVITGAGSGIGRAIALAVAARGGRVLATDINAEGADETVTAIVERGGVAKGRRVDVGDTVAIEQMLEAAEVEFGGIDILINNAGITVKGGFPAADLEEWQRVLNVNLRAVILGTQLVLPRLRKRGGGAVVQTASMAAFVGFPPDPVYSATKAGVVMFTHSLRYLGAQGIRVNCVCPGLVNTPLVQQAVAEGEPPPWLGLVKMLEPEDIANPVVDILEDDSLYGRAMQIMPGMRLLAELPDTGMVG